MYVLTFLAFHGHGVYSLKEEGVPWDMFWASIQYKDDILPV